MILAVMDGILKLSSSKEIKLNFDLVEACKTIF